MRKRLLWACGIFLGIFLVGVIGNSVREIAEKQQKTTKPHELPMSEVQPKTKVDQTKAQPVTQVEDGIGGVNYDTLQTKGQKAPEPAALPSPTPPTPQKVANLVLCDDAPTPTPTPRPTDPNVEAKEDYWLARGHYIPVVTAGEMDSSHMASPMVFIVTRSVYQLIEGKAHLCIPAFSRILGFATNGYTRDKVQFTGKFSLLYVTEGKEVEFEGIACDQEYDPVTNHYGEFDKSPGIKGKFVQSDHMAFVRNLFGFFLDTTQKVAGGVANGLIQRESGNVMSVQFPSNAPFMKDWIDGIVNPNQLSDTVFVQIPALKPAYILNTSIVEPRLASKGAMSQRAKGEYESDVAMTPQEVANEAVSIARENIKAIKAEKKESKDETNPAASLK